MESHKLHIHHLILVQSMPHTKMPYPMTTQASQILHTHNATAVPTVWMFCSNDNMPALQDIQTLWPLLQHLAATQTQLVVHAVAEIPLPNQPPELTAANSAGAAAQAAP